MLEESVNNVWKRKV